MIIIGIPAIITINYYTNQAITSMKLLVMLLCLAPVIDTTVQAQNEKERLAIEIVSRGYLQAWYLGDDQLMAATIHPQMAKKIVFSTGSKNGALAYLSSKDLLAQTRNKRVQQVSQRDLVNSITILDLYNNTAMVKAETPSWIDYLHLAKISGEWKIVNILWELKQEEL